MKNTCLTCFIPSGISPNDDGVNDNFEIVGLFKFPSHHLQIFNRWGELIFETSNVNESWDGRYKNQPGDIGVYVWVVNYTGLRRATLFSESLSGNVTLIR